MSPRSAAKSRVYPLDAASVAVDEIAQFSRHAKDWWNPNGKFRPLHRLNPIRVRYVRDHVCAHFGRDTKTKMPLKALTVLDVGCGGGLMTEPLARLGARVTGLDASFETIAVAKAHAKEVGVTIDYRSNTVESLLRTRPRYDIITALEIVEHVADLDSFLNTLSALMKPNGVLVMSTLNRTPKSFLLGIVAAEYILGWVPRNTHQWKKFIRPSEMTQRLGVNGLRVIDVCGLIFNPLRGAFELRNHDLDVNYLMVAVRDEEKGSK